MILNEKKSTATYSSAVDKLSVTACPVPFPCVRLAVLGILA